MKYLEFRVDTPALLKEIADAGLIANGGVLFIPLNTLRNYLLRVAQRASEINDPQLNILMLKMNLYEMPPLEIVKAIEAQEELL